MSEHTPGPWIVSMPHIKTAEGLGFLATVSNNPEMLADARLIAAAPALLAAAEQVLNTRSKAPITKAATRAYRELATAIAQAKGE